ncbi:hypothetical protein cypCar_00013602 [Cyprinus carpio]|nr:hypothetical protein cypCar_00013602 [Cyprinus carpio]
MPLKTPQKLPKQRVKKKTQKTRKKILIWIMKTMKRPMFEDDIQSVMELEMEDLENWMAKGTGCGPDAVSCVLISNIGQCTCCGKLRYM